MIITAAEYCGFEFSIFLPLASMPDSGAFLYISKAAVNLSSSVNDSSSMISCMTFCASADVRIFFVFASCNLVKSLSISTAHCSTDNHWYANNCWIVLLPTIQSTADLLAIPALVSFWNLCKRTANSLHDVKGCLSSYFASIFL